MVAAPLVSICIPAHNAEAFVQKAVESALAQTWPAVEVIVVDDGSTDGTPAQAREFGDRIRLICQENRGSNPARNVAWREARGDWLQFLDADDYLLPGKIEQQLHEAGALDDAAFHNQVAALVGPVLEERWHDDHPGELTEGASGMSDGLDPLEQWFRWLLPQTGGVLWSRSFFERLGGWNERQPTCQEYELYGRLLREGFPMVFTRHAAAVYRIWSESSLCRRDPVAHIQTRTRLIDDFVDWLKTMERWNATLEAAAGQTCFEMARILAQHDMDAAETYAADRMARGLWTLAGPAAPWKYRAVYQLGGFRRAESAASLLRPRGSALQPGSAQS